MTTLHRCGICTVPFQKKDCPIPEGHCVVTPCFHIYCQSCLGDWVKASTGSCPECRGNVYQHKAGKDFPIIWSMFLRALQKNPEIVIDAMREPSSNGQCSSCLDEHQLLPLFFWEGHLLHETCALPEGSWRLTVDDVVKVVKICANTFPELGTLLTPPPPSLYDRVQRDVVPYITSWLPSFERIRSATQTLSNTQ